MASTPWAVQRIKRKRPSTEPATRKKVRISDDVERDPSSSSKSRNQQTLTQIQWVNSPHASFEHDLDLQDIGLDHPTEDTKVPTGKRRARQRDSTLTQMDWLGSTHTPKEELIDDLAMLSKPKHENKENVILQLDGAHDTPKPLGKRRRIDTPGIISGLSERTSEGGSRGYKLLGSGKKHTSGKSPIVTPRRRSMRIASKTDMNSEEGLKQSSKTSIPSEVDSAQHKPDNTSALRSSHLTEPSEIHGVSLHGVQPHTPRRRKEVPSSQTPETLMRAGSRIRQNTDVSPSKRQRRTPLRDKSINIQPRTYSQGLKASKLMLGHVNESPKRSKVCVLKIPSKGLLQRSSRTDEAERDIFSLPATSSSSQTDRKLGAYHPTENRGQNLLHKEESLEIPPTSEPRSSSDGELPSSPPVIETQGSLPELSDLIPVQMPASTSIAEPGHGDVHHQAHGLDSVLVHDFGRASQNGLAPIGQEHTMNTTERGDDEDEMLLDNDIQVPEPGKHVAPAEAFNSTDDGKSDLGSPVRNDTQFNINLLQRTSSPPSAIGLADQHKHQGSTSVSGSPTPRHTRPTPSKGAQGDIGVQTETPIPTPRLIQNRGTPVKGPATHDDGARTSDISILSSDSYETVSTVPLNDIPQPPSSPPMLPPARPMTQRSIHPASMPRPSQISTQAPTQNDFPSSAPAATQGYGEVERILIKDSSSVPPRLSQIPSNVGKSQSQAQNLRFIGDSDDEIDDLDLDPASSTLRHRHSARKRQNLLRKETGSSLKSIYLPIPESTEQRVEATQDQPSSPPLEPLMPPPRRRDPPQRGEALISQETALESDLTSSPMSSPNPSPLKKSYDSIPGFDNDTQSNFTQDGHITAAYIHREREAGRLPDWFTPLPHQIPNFTGRAKDRRKTRKEKS